MGILDKQIDTVTGFYPMVPLLGGGSTTPSNCRQGATSPGLRPPRTSRSGHILIGTGETQELARSAIWSRRRSPKPSCSSTIRRRIRRGGRRLNIGNPEADGGTEFAMESTDTFDGIAAAVRCLGLRDINVGWRFFTVSADIFALALGLLRRRSPQTDERRPDWHGGPRTSRPMALMGALINFAMVAWRAPWTAPCAAGAERAVDEPDRDDHDVPRGSRDRAPARRWPRRTRSARTPGLSPANVINTYATTEDDQFAEMLAVYELSDSHGDHERFDAAAGAY